MEDYITNNTTQSSKPGEEMPYLPQTSTSHFTIVTKVLFITF